MRLTRQSSWPCRGMKLWRLFVPGLLASSLGLSAAAKFIDKDTLEVTAQGKAQKSGSSVRDASRCQEAARVEAQRIAIETLVDLQWPNVKGKVSREKYGEKTIQTTQGSIRGGRVVSVKVDDSSDPVSCTVTFRIERLNPAATHKRVMQALDAEAAGKKEMLATPTPK